MKLTVYTLFILEFSFGLPAPHNEIKITAQYLTPNKLNNIEVHNNLSRSRIIGGDEVEPHSVPYQVALLINNALLCGGSLISTSKILSAAHCTIDASFVEVILGAHNVNIVEKTQIRVTSSNIINHEEYTVFLVNDISLVILPTAVTLDSAIQIIKLAPASAPSFEGSSAFLSGWGMVADNSTISPVLRGVPLNIISNEECGDSFLFIKDYHICTSGAGVIGACNSDSGSPLVVDGVQVGIVSFGSGCLNEKPTGFVRVSYYSNWLQKYI